MSGWHELDSGTFVFTLWACKRSLWSALQNQLEIYLNGCCCARLNLLPNKHSLLACCFHVCCILVVGILPIWRKLACCLHGSHQSFTLTRLEVSLIFKLDVYLLLQLNSRLLSGRSQQRERASKTGCLCTINGWLVSE